MRRRKIAKRIVESSDSEDDIPLKKLHPSPNVPDTKPITANEAKQDQSSSSESDIESYLQPIHKIDLSSSFFNTGTKNEDEFEKIEKQLFSGITRLSDSESDAETNEEIVPQTLQESKQTGMKEDEPSTSAPRLNFQQLEKYTKRIEEVKKHIEKYNAKKKSSKKTQENGLDISNLLALGESKQITLETIKPEDLHSSDFESCDSEQDDWEEVKVKDSQEKKETLIPKEGLQIVVDMPETCRRKKGVDLLAAMKRRLNRIRKENQVYVHKVHLLCWIAHGNYVNQAINDTQTLALALSLLPSDKCYPSDRTDLNYLEQIVQWYKKTVRLIEKPVSKKMDLVDMLKLQISKKEAYDRKMLVCIFIAILRALGIQCRLVLSFQVEPLKPPASELHSLAKEDTKNKKTNSKSKVQSKQAEATPEISKISNNKNKTTNNVKGTTSLKASKAGDKALQQTKNEGKVSKKPVEDRNMNGDGEILAKVNRSKESNAKKEDNKTKVGKAKGKKQESSTLSVKETKNKRSKSEDTNVNTKVESSKTGSTQRKLRSQHVKNKETSQVQSANSLGVTETRRGRLKSDDDKVGASKGSKSKVTKKAIIKVKLPKKDNKTKAVPQLDGTDNSSDEDNTCEFVIPQLDGADDKKKVPSKKPKLKKLNAPATQRTCKVKNHPNRLKSAANGYNSEDDFRPRSPVAKTSTESSKQVQNRNINLPKLKVTPSDKRKDQSPAKQLNVKSDIIDLIKGRITEQKHLDKSRTVKKRRPSSDSDSDSDFMPSPLKKKHHDSDSHSDYFVPKPKVKPRVRIPRKEPGQKILSSDTDSDKTGKRKGNNVWAEVFLEAEEKWISVDVVQGQVHCVNELYTRATHPVSYIVAWDNNNRIKDITKRYCTNFNTITRKLRVDAKWWDETLTPFLGKYTARDREEDDDLNRQQLDQPMPSSIVEYKNHPLYALRRHLLKFEEIYPPDIQPLGYVKKEAVYPRNCVYVCRSRDIWLKEAKVVKPGEKPYKIVKARPKYDKLSNKIITDQLLEIFGEWQTMDYEPPTAENGIVPRNAFGNVELFKACMLPKGTVHLKLPGLNKVCKTMNIDCASAIVGFDFHGGWSHPMYDGFVVCEEFADSVVAAWELEQDEIEKKENEKIEKRVYGNWKKLIKGLLIRERLKAKYDFGEPSTSQKGKEKKAKGPRFSTKKRGG